MLLASVVVLLLSIKISQQINFRSIMGMLTDESLKAISAGALNQLDLDLCQCETFAVSEPVPGTFDH